MGRGHIARAGSIAAFLSFAFAGSAAAAAAATHPAFGASGAMQPTFAWQARDYALRGCEEDPKAEISVRGKKGWRSAVAEGDLRAGSYSVPIDAAAGESVTVAFKRRGQQPVRRYRLRCLPSDFPGYEFERRRKGGPHLFSIQMGNRFGAIFDRNGAPLYWTQAKGEPDNFSVLADGTLTWAPVDGIAMQVADLEVRTLRNELLHRFSGSPGTVADIHELLLLPNGNYMIGAQIVYRDDTSAYGGSADSEVIGIEIQEFTPGGKEVWSWSSRGRIGVEETGRWWDQPILDREPYDVVHWNAVEASRRFILISNRHTDAIYKIDRRSGDIVWKLGGTPTPESLEVRGDPLGEYPFGGQHDIRLEPHGTITIFDNRTALPEPPRVVRYRVNEDRGTARLIDSIRDPAVTATFCCGSARLLDGGDWLVGWGGNPEAGSAAYNESGRLIFRLTLDIGFSYRAIPVPKGTVGRRDLRRAMDAMAR